MGSKSNSGRFGEISHSMQGRVLGSQPWQTPAFLMYIKATYNSVMLISSLTSIYHGDVSQANPVTQWERFSDRSSSFSTQKTDSTRWGSPFNQREDIGTGKRELLCPALGQLNLRMRCDLFLYIEDLLTIIWAHLGWAASRWAYAIWFSFRGCL